MNKKKLFRYNIYFNLYIKYMNMLTNEENC